MSKSKAKGAGGSESKTISFRISAAEWDALARAASSEELSVGELTRLLVLRALHTSQVEHEEEEDATEGALLFSRPASSPAKEESSEDQDRIVDELRAMHRGMAQGFEAVLLNLTNLDKAAVRKWVFEHVLKVNADHE